MSPKHLFPVRVRTPLHYPAQRDERGLDMKNFYKKFKIVSKFPLWPSYLKRVYEKTITDSIDLVVIPINKRKNFTCLLCGVSGEITAYEFIKFVLSNNPESKIIIIDLGEEQIQSVKKLVKEKFSDINIDVKQANALNLSFIKDKSIDWIDTDGFFSFFDEKELLSLFKEWKRIIRNDGYITFRELTSHNVISTLANKTRNIASEIYMGIELHLHSLSELEEDFKKLHFQYNRGVSPIPLLDRYCLVND